MPKPSTGKEDYLTSEIVEKRLGLSQRRLRQIAAEGKLSRRAIVDPVTKKRAVVYRAADVAALEQQREWAEEGLPAIAATTARPVTRLLPVVPDARIEASLHQWLSLAEAAAYIGLKERTLLRLIQEGRLKAMDEHTRGIERWRVRRADLEALEGETQS